MRISCFQIDTAWEDRPANYAAVERMLHETAPPRGGLLALPEMFATGFSMNVSAVAEPPGGPTEAFLSGLARQRGIFVIGGLAAALADGSAQNQAVAFGPDGSILARQPKMHLFSPAGEEKYYGPGDAAAVFDCGPFKAAMAVCYDLRFPEQFRSAAARGAQLFVVPANWPAERASHWAALLTARAIENQAYIVGVNRSGKDHRHEYAGGSVIIDPHGKILALADGSPCAISAEIDLAALLEYRRGFPALSDANFDRFFPKGGPDRPDRLGK